MKKEFLIIIALSGLILFANSAIQAKNQTNKYGIGIQSDLFQVPLTERGIQYHQTAFYFYYQSNRTHFQLGLSDALQLNNDLRSFGRLSNILLGVNYFLPLKWEKMPTSIGLQWLKAINDLKHFKNDQLNFSIRQYVNKNCFLATGINWMQQNTLNQYNSVNWFWQLGLEF